MGCLLVYSDRGCEVVSLRQAVRELRRELSSEVGRIKRSELIEGGWEEGCEALVFPGGACPIFQETLKGEGIARIRHYVQGGGCYLGLCAGGYFGSARIDFDRGHKYEIHEPLDLGFYSGTAEGPSLGLGKFDFESHAGAETQIATLTCPKSRF